MSREFVPVERGSFEATEQSLCVDERKFIPTDEKEIAAETTTYGSAIYVARFTLNDLFAIALGKSTDELGDPHPTPFQAKLAYQFYQEVMPTWCGGDYVSKTTTQVLGRPENKRQILIHFLKPIADYNEPTKARELISRLIVRFIPLDCLWLPLPVSTDERAKVATLCRFIALISQLRAQSLLDAKKMMHAMESKIKEQRQAHAEQSKFVIKQFTERIKTQEASVVALKAEVERLKALKDENDTLRSKIDQVMKHNTMLAEEAQQDLRSQAQHLERQHKAAVHSARAAAATDVHHVAEVRLAEMQRQADEIDQLKHALRDREEKLRINAENSDEAQKKRTTEKQQARALLEKVMVPLAYFDAGQYLAAWHATERGTKPLETSLGNFDIQQVLDAAKHFKLTDAALARLKAYTKQDRNALCRPSLVVLKDRFGLLRLFEKRMTPSSVLAPLMIEGHDFAPAALHFRDKSEALWQGSVDSSAQAARFMAALKQSRSAD